MQNVTKTKSKTSVRPYNGIVAAVLLSLSGCANPAEKSESYSHPELETSGFSQTIQEWVREWEHVLSEGKDLKVVTVGDHALLKTLRSDSFLQNVSVMLREKLGLEVLLQAGPHFSVHRLFRNRSADWLRQFGDYVFRASGMIIPIHDASKEYFQRYVRCTYSYEEKLPTTNEEIEAIVEKINDNRGALENWSYYQDLVAENSLWKLNPTPYGWQIDDILEEGHVIERRYVSAISVPLVNTLSKIRFSECPLMLNSRRMQFPYGSAPIYWATKDGAAFLKKQCGLQELDDKARVLGIELAVARAVAAGLDIPLFRSDATASRGCLSDFTPLDPSPTASWQRIADVDTCPEERRLVEFQVSYLKAMHDLLSGSTKLSRDFTVAYKEFYPKLEPLGQHRYAEIAFGYAIATGDMEEAAYFAPYLDLCLETFTTERSRYEFLFIGFSEDVRARYTAFLRRHCAEFAKKCPEDIQPGILSE